MKVLKMMCLSIFVVGLAACGDGGSAVSSSPDSEPSESNRTVERVEERVEIPEWFPGNLFLPADFEATQALTFGTKTYLLRGISQEGAGDLVTRYRSELANEGYAVREPAQTPDQNSFVMFSGQGLDGAGVRVRDDGDRREIEINFTLLDD